MASGAASGGGAPNVLNMNIVLNYCVSDDATGSI